MAKNLDDGVFWLPPQFLTDDDVFVGKSNNKNGCDGSGLESDYNKSLFPLELPHGLGSFPFPSDLSSPVGSVAGSTETGSREDDYLTPLTRQMSRATMEYDFRLNDFTRGMEIAKDRGVLGSPQSTLCAVGSGCGCRQMPTTLDLLYAVVSRMEMKDDEAYGSNHGRGRLGPPRKTSPVPPRFKHSKPDESSASQSLSHQKLQAYKYQQLKQQQQLLMQQSSQLFWSKGTGGCPAGGLPVVHDGARGTCAGPLDLSTSAWPPLQQALQQHRQGGLDMRSVLFGSTWTKRGSVGTGVFLPRQAGSRPQIRKKPACPTTVVVPAKVVHALKLNLDEMDAGSWPQILNASAPLRVGSNYNAVALQKHSVMSKSRMDHEIRSPQEWSYH